jgi:prepilin-type N-terminal cleavage/methylation domain-containing protein
VKNSTRKFRRGFTLLEVLATLVLIGIILPAVMHGISLATIAAGEAKHKVEAASLAQTKLSELIADYQTLNQTGASGGSFPDYPSYTWSSKTEQRDTNLSQISVRVTWQSRGQERFVDLASLVYTPDSSSGTAGTSGTGTSGATGSGSGTGSRSR